jgi:drug/metabolite transporter (DMT)-like permease
MRWDSYPVTSPTTTDVRGVTRAPGPQVWGPLVALWLIWGSTYLGIAIMGRSMPPMISNGMRFAAAALLLAGAMVLFRGPRVLAITLPQLRSTAIMGTALLGVGIGTLSMAERYVPSGIAALLVSVMPLWILIFRMRAGERPANLTLLGVAAGMGGLILMLLPGGTHPVAGTDGDVVKWSLAIMCSSFCWAFFSWRSSGYELPSNSLVTTVYEMAFAALALTLVGALRGERLHLDQIDSGSWWAWAYLVVASLGGYTAYTWLLGNAPLSLVSTYAYVNPVVAVLLGWVIIGEPLTTDVLLGLTVVVGGVMLVVTGERRR